MQSLPMAPRRTGNFRETLGSNWKWDSALIGGHHRPTSASGSFRVESWCGHVHAAAEPFPGTRTRRVGCLTSNVPWAYWVP